MHRGMDVQAVLQAIPPAVLVEDPSEAHRSYYVLDDFLPPMRWRAEDGERLTGQQLLNYLGDRPWVLLRPGK